MRDGREPLAGAHRYGLALLAAALATFLRWELRGVLGSSLPLVTYFPAVAVIAWIAGAGPAIVCAVLGAAAALLLFMHPLSLSVLTPGPAGVGIVLFLVGSLTLGLEAALLRRAHQRNQERRLGEFAAEARREREAAVRQGEERFRTMIQVVPSLTFEADPEGNNTFASDQWCAYTGMTAEESAGSGWVRAVHPEDMERVRIGWAEAVGAGRPYESKHRLRAADGSYRWFLLRALPSGGEHGGERWAGSLIDIDDLVRTEEALRSAHRDLEQAKLRAENAALAAEEAGRVKDRFLATLSHELRMPLTPVLATADLLSQDPLFPDSYRDDLEMIRRNVDLEARLIGDLLDMTKITQGKLELVRRHIDVPTILKHTVETCRPEMRLRDLGFRLDLEECPCVILADPARMQQVFWNLLTNAIKFTPPGGAVAVRCVCDWEYIVVEVEDSGVGIEPEVLPRIFEAFEQGGAKTTRRFGGLGLGLSISRSIVEMHGGRIEAFSAGKGLGTVFRVTVPVSVAPRETVPAMEASPVERLGTEPPPAGVPAEPASAEHASAEPASAEAASAEAVPAGAASVGLSAAATAGPGPSVLGVIPEMPAPAQAAALPLRILLVEDHEDTARMLCRLLQIQGHEVDVAGAVDAALNLAEEGNYDLLLSDLGLPDGSGLDLVRALRARGWSRPAIALSGYGQEEDVEESRSAGFTMHLTKPVNREDLQAAMAAATAAPRREAA